MLSRVAQWHCSVGSAWTAIIRASVIQCYAPTNNSEEETKDHFYSSLQSILENCREKDVTIPMGDFNANIGMDNNGYEEAMGTHGIGEMNEKGERFADTCAQNNIVIGGSILTYTYRVIQDHMGVTRSLDREPDRSYLHRKEI